MPSKMSRDSPSQVGQTYYRSPPMAIPNDYQRNYYPPVPASIPSQPMVQQQSYAPVQYAPPQQSQQQSVLRASTGAWTPSDDNMLMTARAQGLNWAPIQATYFPNKTPNACRKRHERLMDRRNSDDWDALKLENLGKEYMAMRRDIWSPLAARTGDKWTVVEQKCLSSGLKNLQSAARAGARRDRLSNISSGPYQELDPRGASSFNDSGISAESEYGTEDYSPDDTSARVYNPQQGGQQYAQMGGPPQHRQRVSSTDMGIGAIINRGAGGA